MIYVSIFHLCACLFLFVCVCVCVCARICVVLYGYVFVNTLNSTQTKTADYLDHFVIEGNHDHT